VNKLLVMVILNLGEVRGGGARSFFTFEGASFL
jgi:hypothetical protein